jgi:hypothetical protein
VPAKRAPESSLHRLANRIHHHLVEMRSDVEGSRLRSTAPFPGADFVEEALLERVDADRRREEMQAAKRGCVVLERGGMKCA